jgi:chromosome segregation ATPase
VRTSGASGENRRDVHLATQTLSKTAAETKGQLLLSKQLTALQKRFAVTDEQLTQCKLELRNARRDNERLQLEYEEMNRRCHAAIAERGTAMKQLNEVKEEKSKLETRMTVAVNQHGKVGVQRHAKMLETVKELRGAKEEVDSALQQANTRIAQLEDELSAARSALRKREEHLGLIPVGSSADAKANRCSVLLAVSKLQTQQDALTRDKEALEAEKEALQSQKSSLK